MCADSHKVPSVTTTPHKSGVAGSSLYPVLRLGFGLEGFSISIFRDRRLEVLKAMYLIHFAGFKVNARRSKKP